LPWALLVVSSVASLAANMAVAEPSLIGRVIAAWPSFALIASDELLMRQVRRAAEPGKSRQRSRGVRSRPEGAQSAGRPGVGLPDAQARADLRSACAFASARWRAAPGVMRENGGFGAECGDPPVPQQEVP
jgi:hypothetical protein